MFMRLNINDEQLVNELIYGNNYEEKNLRRMMQFAQVFDDESIVVSLIRQLSWTHFIALIPLKIAQYN
jgi:DNA-binding SARP family transcriptional activator